MIRLPRTVSGPVSPISVGMTLCVKNPCAVNSGMTVTSGAVRLLSTVANEGFSFQKAAVISSATRHARRWSTCRQTSPPLFGLICDPCPASINALLMNIPIYRGRRLARTFRTNRLFAGPAVINVAPGTYFNWAVYSRLRLKSRTIARRTPSPIFDLRVEFIDKFAILFCVCKRNPAGPKSNVGRRGEAFTSS